MLDIFATDAMDRFVRVALIPSPGTFAEFLDLYIEDKGKYAEVSKADKPIMRLPRNKSAVDKFAIYFHDEDEISAINMALTFLRR